MAVTPPGAAAERSRDPQAAHAQPLGKRGARGSRDGRGLTVRYPVWTRLGGYSFVSLVHRATGGELGDGLPWSKTE